MLKKEISFYKVCKNHFDSEFINENCISSIIRLKNFFFTIPDVVLANYCKKKLIDNSILPSCVFDLIFTFPYFWLYELCPKQHHILYLTLGLFPQVSTSFLPPITFILTFISKTATLQEYRYPQSTNSFAKFVLNAETVISE